MAALLARRHDFEAAEEAISEAFLEALERWSLDAFPERPGALLTVIARRRLVDAQRRRATEERRLQEARPIVFEPDDESFDAKVDAAVEDERLRLLYLVSHPALAAEARLPLALNAVMGLSAARIARLLLQTEKTIAQRLVRAKRKIREARLPLVLPPEAELAERTENVLRTTYLLFTRGVDEDPAPHGRELVDEALRLARLVHRLLPEEPGAGDLLALLLFVESRRAARTDADGAMIPLDRQDRSLWNRAQIAEAEAILTRPRPGSRRTVGTFELEAAIQGLHALAPSFAATDWRRIVALYDALDAMAPSPVVRLNRAVAILMRDGPAAGLAALDALRSEPALLASPFLMAARAECLSRLGRREEAMDSFRRAVAAAMDPRQRLFLSRRLAEFEGDGAPSGGGTAPAKP